MFIHELHLTKQSTNSSYFLGGGDWGEEQASPPLPPPRRGRVGALGSNTCF